MQSGNKVVYSLKRCMEGEKRHLKQLPPAQGEAQREIIYYYIGRHWGNWSSSAPNYEEEYFIGTPQSGWKSLGHYQKFSDSLTTGETEDPQYINFLKRIEREQKGTILEKNKRIQTIFGNDFLVGMQKLEKLVETEGTRSALTNFLCVLDNTPHEKMSPQQAQQDAGLRSIQYAANLLYKDHNAPWFNIVRRYILPAIAAVMVGVKYGAAVSAFVTGATVLPGAVGM